MDTLRFGQRPIHIDLDLEFPCQGYHSPLRVNHATKAVSTFVPTGIVANAKGMAFGPDGHFHVADAANSRILRFNGDSGALIDTFVTAGSDLDTPGGIVFGPDRNTDGIPDLYVSSTITNEVLVFSGTNGSALGAFVTAGSGGMLGPHDLEFGPDGNLYVMRSNDPATIGNEQVYRYNGTTGAFIDIVVPPVGIDRETSFITFDDQGNLLISSEGTNNVLRYAAGPLVSLSAPSSQTVSIDFSVAPGSATPGADYGSLAGRLTFAPGQTSKRILVSTVDDAAQEGNETFFVNLSNPIGGVISDGQGISTIIDNDGKFYVIDDAASNRTFEYGDTGSAGENYALAAANTAPRGAASTAAGDKVWVVDANKNIYVYGTSGNLLGLCAAGSIVGNPDVQGIATNGTDVWIVDAKSDKIYRYAGAATRLSGSQNAASSFSLNSGNKDASDIVTDGASIWVLNNSSTDKVFKYMIGGSFDRSWTITGGGGNPTGTTIDPSGGTDMWIVDNSTSSTDKVYLLPGARNAANNSSVPATQLFALAAGNTNPLGLADPPTPAIGGETTAFAGSSSDSALLSIVGELDGLLCGGKKRK